MLAQQQQSPALPLVHCQADEESAASRGEVRLSLAQKGVVFCQLASRHRTAGACVATQLAARIAISNLHKSTLKSFSET